ncbi:MAG TPA: BTAD domain-containing putative transcriptional regulator [Streptosporangiaceae bacterium]|nr:BTAD domain-containing putative transcriptional regulator [Streptosporangiaceae bacterium]
MAVEWEFCLLGPMVVRRHGAVMPIQAGKQRALLARLLLDANRAVPVDDIAETLWGHEPPPSARVGIRNYIKRLRQALGQDGAARISTERRGYMISVATGELDVSEFEILLASARTAARARAWGEAGRQATAALALWRDEPLVDVESELLAAREGPRLAELRLQALETRLEAELRSGGPADVITELERLVLVHPLREHPHALLMLALYRSGRQAEALASYQRARRHLIDELGAEPGAELRELHRRILSGDEELAEPGSVPATGPAPERVVPRELPSNVRHFTGRAPELAELTGLLDRAGEEPGTSLISVIGGTAGVGKTALALHWAHQVAGRFPDGQLYVDLRGYDPGEPVPAADALAHFLRALGVAGRDIPAETDERAARYRSLLAGRRMLIVLDNAGDAEHVRPLLPGAPDCVSVVTSRDALPGLVARDGAVRLDLGLMPSADAVGLLAALVGARVDADPDAAGALAVRCGLLPLALRVAAELATARPTVPLAALAGELATRRLDLLDGGGDPRAEVRAVFSWSYRNLAPGPAGVFRLAGLHPGPDLEPGAVAALAGLPVDQASQMLAGLARANLVQPASPGRYLLHDLLRGYARDLTVAQDGEPEQQTALTRLLDYYLHAAAAAMNTLFPAERHRRPAVPDPASPESVLPVPALATEAEAQTWLDAERASLVAAITHAAQTAWPGHATLLAGVLFRYFDTGGHFPEAIIVHGWAEHAAHRAGDRVAEGDALTSLGVVYGHQGRYERATGHFERALSRYREAGYQVGQARALNYLGLTDSQLGRYRQATTRLRQALDLYRQTGERTGEAYALSNLGAIDRRRGRYRSATGHQRQALALLRDLGDRHGEATALSRLGVLGLRQEHFDEAIGDLQRALALFREFGDRQGEAMALTRLGAAELGQGRHRQAVAQIQQALAVLREIADPSGQAEALNDLGDVFLASGRHADARAQYAAALDLASEAGDQDERARAHDGLAHGYQAIGDHAAARGHWREALRLYPHADHPEARRIRGQLGLAGPSGRPTRVPGRNSAVRSA